MARDVSSSGPAGFIRDFAGRLRYPQLFFFTAGLFLVDLFVPDFIPFADEILLGLLTVMLARFKDRRREPSRDEEDPPIKNVTPGKE